MATADDDVWDYKPIKRGKKSKVSNSGSSSIIAHQKNTRKTKTSKVKLSVDVAPSNGLENENAISERSCMEHHNNPCVSTTIGASPSNNNTRPPENTCVEMDTTQNCPFCQMPFKILRVQSPRWHVMECMDLPIKTTQECPAGLKCDDTTSGHYRKFRHSLLADLRSGVPNEAAKMFECTSSTKCHNEDSTESAQQEVDSAKRKLNFSSSKKPSNIILIENDINKLVEPKKDILIGKGTAALSDNVDQAKKKLSFSVRKSDNGSKASISNGMSQDKSDSTLCVHDIFPDQHDISESMDEESPSRKRKLVSSLENDEDIPSNKEAYLTKVKPYENSTKNDIQNETLSIGNTTENNSCDVEIAQDKAADDVNENSCNSDIDIFQDDTLDDGDDDFFSTLEIDQNSAESDKITGESPTGENSQLKPCTDSADSNVETFEIEEQGLCDRTEPSKFGFVFDMNDTLTLSQNAVNTSKPVASASKSFLTLQANTQNHNAQTKSKSLPIRKCSSQTSISSFFKPKNNAKTTLKVNSLQTLNPTTPSTSNKIPAHAYQNPIKPTPANTLTRSKTLDVQPVASSSKPQPRPVSLKQASSNKNTYRSTQKSSGFGNDPETTATTSGGGGGYQRKCPFYKKMPGTPFTVDAFRYGSIPGCSAYFLTHFHYDHYGGLRKSFAHPIYCTKETANLVEKKIKVDRRYLNPITLNTPTMVHGVEVTFLDANHCPGAVIILFKLPDGRVYLHTGDFRAIPAMQDYPELRGVRVNQLYLDTTYCDPSYAFPPQDDVIRFAVNTTQDFLREHPNGLIAVGSYTIGKERIFMGIAEALNCKVHVSRDKKNVLDCLENEAITRRITLDQHVDGAKVHVVAMKDLNFQSLSTLLTKTKTRFDAILAFEPTGWTHSSRLPSVDNIKPKWKRDKITLYGIPYSEHSSYTEMKEFCQFIKADKILPTVNNGNPQARKKMEALFESWAKESPSKQMRQQKLGAFFGGRGGRD